MASYRFLSLLAFVKFTGPSQVEKKEWERQNQALKAQLQPLHQEIDRAPTDQPEYIATLGDSLTSVIRKFFVDNSDFFEDEAPTLSSNKFISNKSSNITQLKIIKKETSF